MGRFLPFKRLDLQAKIILVLIAVIVPTFLLVTLVEYRVTQPILEEEVREVGITSGKTIAAEIVNQRFLSRAEPTPAIETYLQEFLYSQPSIIRVDVLIRDPKTGQAKNIASNIEDEAGLNPTTFNISDTIVTQRITDESTDLIDVLVPIEIKSRDVRGPKRLLGTVHLEISMKFVSRLAQTLLKVTAAAAGFSVVLLLLVLSYFLRKTINNDRLLRRAETRNLELSEQLHDLERELMNTEKLAVMGQLTASFAHEIGTPLNAVGGHLQLLKDDLAPQGNASFNERVEIINGQLQKIEGIVKGFLQSTAKPVSQRQLVDLNRITQQTLRIVQPRMDSLGVELTCDLDRQVGPIRIVPIELEQILLNLLNNSVDSLRAKSVGTLGDRKIIELTTGMERSDGKEWAKVSVYDTGEGIKKMDLTNVLKPFFTTKRPGEGTGLGLTICQELARKYGGMLEIESKEGAWTRVTLKLPYEDPRS